MTKADAVDYIRARHGLIFSVRFKKRTTGEIREMVCRQGVKAGLVEEPTKPGLDFKQHGLIPVWDMTAGAHRSIPMEGILALRIDGEWVGVEG